ncbi:MAG: hypothetical protein JWN69_182, partial [Alphaproteobacteria bacterium]|nr:hypothetical protein [Alphaproteobacteria bacterium]
MLFSNATSSSVAIPDVAGSQLARLEQPPYCRFMLGTRLMRFMIILAVLLAPLGMIGGTPAYATAKQAPAGAMSDCAGMQKQSKDEPAQSRDCMMACAAILQ